MSTSTELKEKDRDDLVLAICNKHDGFSRVAKKIKLRIKSEAKPKGYWEDIKNLDRELRPIIADNDGKMPTAGYLEKIGRNDLKVAISRKHGGFPEVGERLGCYTEKKKPSGYWKDSKNIKKELKYIEKELKIIIDKLDGKTPSAGYLEKAEGDLLNKIRKIGKYNQVVEMLEFKVNKKSNEYWNNEDNIKKELLPYCKKLGEMPNPKYLKDNSRYDLLTAIYNKWSFDKIKKMLGYD